MKQSLVIVLAVLTMSLIAAIGRKDADLPEPRASHRVGAWPPAFGPIHPRISPDGRQIAVSHQGAIWRVPREGGTMTRLTDGAGFDIEPVWSPDGKRMAYVNAPQMGGGALHLMDAESGAPVELPAKVQIAETMFYAKLEFHPDGRLLGNLRVDSQEIGLALVDLSTGKHQPIVRAPKQARFALSHDGRWLAYTSSMDTEGQQSGNDGPQADIWRIETTGGAPERISRFASRVFDMCWSPDGNDLYVVSDLGGAHYDLWRMPISDPERGARRITFGHADEDRPSISRDGRWLAFTDNRTGPTELVVRDTTSGVDTTVQISNADFRQPSGRLRLRTIDHQTGKPVTARLSLRHEQGKFHAPPGALHRLLNDYAHFYCEGAAEIELPVGRYALRAFRGPEYRVADREFSVAAGEPTELTVPLERWTDAAARGWYSGENHIHANYGWGQWYNSPPTMLQQCAGEDLRVCNFMVANSDTNGVFDREHFRGRPDALSTAETTLYWNQEFRSTLWGHMTLVNLTQVVEPVFTGFKDTTNPWDWPTNSDIADRTHLQKGLVNYTHGAFNVADPYQGAYTGKGIPVDVALGKIDTLDLNMSYAGTVPLWYRLLNCGFRLPASAGTDCFLNRIRSRLPGGDRVYVKVDGDFTYGSWIDGLRAGRSFVTSGPMLELTVENRGPGETLRIAAPREIRFSAKAISQFPLNRVEVVSNGEVVARGTLSADQHSSTMEGTIPVSRSGWISFRAAGPTHPDHSAGALEAHASPVYIQVGDRATASREDADYFLKWIERLSLQLRVRDRLPSAQIRQHVEGQLEAARAVYTRIAQSAE